MLNGKIIQCPVADRLAVTADRHYSHRIQRRHCATLSALVACFWFGKFGAAVTGTVGGKIFPGNSALKNLQVV